MSSAERGLAEASESMGRSLDTTDLPELIMNNLDDPEWDEVAEALPELRQLHPGLPHLFLLGCC